MYFRHKSGIYFIVTFFIFIFLILFIYFYSNSPIYSKSFKAEAFEEAEPLFHQNARWLGADAALSIPLDNNRTLWLFGDTFIAESGSHTRVGSKMVRNTIAIQNGIDPLRAKMDFHWKEDINGLPSSFFPERAKHWYWPGHGSRVDTGELIIFLYIIKATTEQSLGFKCVGYAVAVIKNPDIPVERWNPSIIDIATSKFDAIPATAVIQDGNYTVALAIAQKGVHSGTLVRYPTSLLKKGNVNKAQWWTGKKRGWILESMLGDDKPETVLDDAGSECSVHWDERKKLFVHIASYGFGASTIGLRTAKKLTGPWTSVSTIYSPPESNVSGAFVYAAKAHPELTSLNPNDLIITYATNSFKLNDLFSKEGETSLYWPRFVIVSYR